MKFPFVRSDEGFKVLGRELPFRGRFVSVSVEHIRLPGGHETRHEILHLPSAVAVVPLLEERPGKLEVVLIEQFRSSVEGYILEIPAGIIEEGEAPGASAARELEEETGYRARSITPLAMVFPIPGTSAHQMHFYLAEGLYPGTQQLEAAECLTVKRFPLEEVLRSILHGAPQVIVDAKTHVGVLHASMRLRVAP